MNWIKKTIGELKSQTKKIFRKMPTFTEVESSPWTSCCEGPILKETLKKNLFVCPKCNKHHKITNLKDRFSVLFGENNYKILDIKIDKSLDDPLSWIDEQPYRARLRATRQKTGLNCAVQFATGTLPGGINITAGAMCFDFMGASIGIHEGNTICAGIDHAIKNKTPLVFFPCGGGQRMYESIYSLHQMTRTSIKISEFKETKLPYITNFVSPCYGGITASFVWADICLAEPDALIGFAGPRIILAQTPGEIMDDNFQKSSSLLRDGFLDHVVERKNIKETITNLLSILLKKNELKMESVDEDGEQQNIKKTSVAS